MRYSAYSCKLFFDKSMYLSNMESISEITGRESTSLNGGFSHAIIKTYCTIWLKLSKI